MSRRQLAAACALLPVALAASSPVAETRFAVSFPAAGARHVSTARAAHALGRFHGEPRFQINDGASTQLIFGSMPRGYAPGRRR